MWCNPGFFEYWIKKIMKLITQVKLWLIRYLGLVLGWSFVILSWDNGFHNLLLNLIFKIAWIARQRGEREDCTVSILELDLLLASNYRLVFSDQLRCGVKLGAPPSPDAALRREPPGSGVYPTRSAGAVRSGRPAGSSFYQRRQTWSMDWKFVVVVVLLLWFVERNW